MRFELVNVAFAGSRLYRDSTTANYYDGVYRIDESLPSARAISDLVFKGER